MLPYFAYLTIPVLIALAPNESKKLKEAIEAYKNRNGLNAVELFTPLANSGNRVAQYFLGQIYWEGSKIFPGISADKDLGWSLIKKSADSGFAEAEYFVGIAHWLGHDQPKDVEAAVEWIRRAANHGHVPAMGMLGNAFWGGDALEGVKRDPKIAMTWFKRAAKKGDSHSMFMIAKMYMVGAGVPQDYIEAHAWMNVAASREKAIPDFVIEQRESLARRMTAAQVSKAQTRAKTLAKEIKQTDDFQ